MKSKIFSLLLFSLVSYTFSFTPAINLSSKQTEYSLADYLEYYKDPARKLSINDIITPAYSDNFKPLRSNYLNFGYTEDAIWVKFKIKTSYRNTKILSWIIELKYPHISFIDYYLFTEKGICLDSIKTGSLRSITDQYPLFIFTPEGEKNYTVYFKLISNDFLIAPFHIFSTPTFIKHRYKEDLLNGIYFGFMVLILLVNLFAYYTFKDKSYIYFILFLISFLLFYISYMGFGAIFLWPKYLYWNFISKLFFVIFSVFSFILFIDSFIEAKKTLPFWHKIYLFIITFCLLFLSGLFYIDYNLSIVIIIVLLTFSLLTTIIPVATLWKKGSRDSGLFLLSLFGFSLGIIGTLLAHKGLITSYALLKGGLTYGSLLFVIIISLLLRARISSMLKEKKKIDNSLRKSEEKLKSIFETTNDIIWEIDIEAKYTYISPNCRLILGYKPQEMIGKCAFDFMSDDEARRNAQLYDQSKREKKAFIQVENIHIDKNGNNIVLESSGVPFFDDKGNLLGYRGIDRDITIRKRTIEEKVKSERNLRALLNATIEVAFLIDSDYRIITANDAFAALAKKNVTELIGQYALDLLPDKMVKIRKAKMDEVLSTGKPVRWEDYGVKGWSENSLYPICDSHGKVTSIAVFSVNISKRKQAELVREVMLNIANAVFITKNMKELYKTIHNEINKLIAANNFFVGLYNEENQTINMAYIVDEKDDFEGISIPLEKSLSAQVILHKKAMLLTRKDMIELDKQGITGSGYGTPSMSWLGVPLLDNSHKIIGLIVIQDYSTDNAYHQSDLDLMEFVSKQISMSIMKKQDEEKIHILSQSVEQSPTIIMITDTDGYIEYVNPRFTEITGFSYKETIGKKPNILKSGETPDSVYKELWGRITNGRDWKGEFHNKKKDGDFYWEYTHISPIKNEEGAITHYLALKEDISEQKILQQQLIQSQRMEAVGTLAGGIAHDFNNILTVIKGFSEIALLKTSDTAPIHKDLLSILSAGNKAEKLTKQILAFSRKQIYQPRIIAINTVITELQKMIRRLIGDDITVELNLNDNLPMIKADPSQIEQILMNLIINARDAINHIDNFKGEKKIVIRSDKIVLSEKELDGQKISDNGEYILFSISDNGIGIAEDIKTYIFDPFFTTKETGKGTGLGLATVYGIVKQNNGLIRFNSKLGTGSEFIIYWPATIEKIPLKNNLKKAGGNLKGHEKILFVEDDENLLNFGKTVLSEYGYQVITAANANDALELAKKTDGIELLITDYLMPRMNGMQLYEKINELIPNINVILISGYSQKHIASNENFGFLQKPFSVQNLLSKVRNILDKK